MAARAGVNVCLRKFDPKTVFDLIRAEGVTHCGAPIVQSALANAPAELRAGITHTVRTMVAGAAPAPSVIAKMKEIGFELTHVYGLTEVYGPAAVCARQASWDTLEDEERACSTRARACAITCRPACRYAIPKPCSKSRPTSRPWARSCSAATSA